MKLLLYSWNANNEQILADNLTRLGFEVVWFNKECEHYTRDMEFAMEMIPCIHEQGAEAVVSFDYFPIISMICNTCQIPYYAWVYDCPHFTLYAKQISLPCNHIGIFDRGMVRQLEDYGITTVYHAPLAVDVEYFESVIARASRKEREKYQSDISFVGSLYTDEHNYYDVLFPDGRSSCHVCGTDNRTIRYFENVEHMTCVSDYDDVNALIKRQCFSYVEDYLGQAVESGQIDLSRLQKPMEEQGLMLGEDYFARPQDILMAAVLEKKVTVEERKILLSQVAGNLVRAGSDRRDNDGRIIRDCDFRLYTGSDTASLPELDVCNRGMVDYHTQMPLVFAGSKINLNISLRSIHSGIPLRVLDIMACGGFVLTNWQPEIAEYFEEGREIVTFGSAEECLDKLAYYLEHDKERTAIAMAGRRSVKERFGYREGLYRLFQLEQ